jgi:hypothetical protein
MKPQRKNSAAPQRMKINKAAYTDLMLVKKVFKLHGWLTGQKD